jgi:hypothetical protein
MPSLLSDTKALAVVFCLTQQFGGRSVRIILSFQLTAAEVPKNEPKELS